ncbi:MAG: hypothetical protein U5K31_09505 [Balneolaceae bacterium]|nr:hypothetical protein [Balneolaceae bacterium]
MSEEQFLELVRGNEERFRHLCRIYADRSAGKKDLYQEVLIQIWRAPPSRAAPPSTPGPTASL